MSDRHTGSPTIAGPDGNTITDWRDWTRPKKLHQWRAGRSAMELARAWFISKSAICPREIHDVLASHSRCEGLQLTSAYPEYVTSLPQRGEGRNHDLLILGQANAGGAVISVEAKVDESFGETIGTYWARAKASKTRTRAPERIESLLTILFGRGARPNVSPWKGLRYQLLTAVVGTALEASRRNVAMGIVLVHEFRTESSTPENEAVNAEDFQAFVATLVQVSKDDVLPGRLYGPTLVASEPHLMRPVEILLGKAVYDWEPDQRRKS